MVLDRLGILTDEVYPDHFAKSLDWIAEQGLKHIEVRVVDGVNIANMSDEQVADVRRQVEARGLSVSAIASPLYKCALDPTRPVATGDVFGQAEESVEAHHEKLHRVIAIAKQLGARGIRIFSFWREREPERYFDDIVAHLKKAAAVAEREGVLLLQENEPACNGGFADEIGRIVRAVGSPAMKALWDPGNEAYGGRPAFPEGYEAIKDVLAHVHIKDAYVRPDGTSRCVPVGSGTVPFIAQLRALAEDGYDGLFTIETHFAPEGGTKAAGSRMTLDAFRVLVAEAFPAK
ncbi:sugar phosphate isomerase/epimerase family protein [Paenibacillus flagellatus]|uniref:Sugar phosphate isomerase/epimerase n=1 Tax=Paenibacillus flagellatus TaxID=2211139 RepID=A0A2V5KMH0_9BACL|nr:sugar phosphate isomerase/epimerase family protein [Paenibacillus flagellatus]PYI52137.1 sugar phosphate isomerase/epimerase [Paenibacillus flagellatus]